MFIVNWVNSLSIIIGQSVVEALFGGNVCQSAVETPMTNRRHCSEASFGQSAVEAPFGGTVWPTSGGESITNWRHHSDAPF